MNELPKVERTTLTMKETEDIKTENNKLENNKKDNSRKKSYCNYEQREYPPEFFEGLYYNLRK